MASTNPARGMRDFLPSDVRKRNYVINIIKEVYESYGFEPLETPAVENLETLTGKYGEEGTQLMFKILKRGEKLDIEKAAKESDLSDLALRYDLTVPLARVVANNRNDLPKFFKRYQIQPVWRADRPAKGRFREFYQCDVDCIGSTSLTVEAELINAVSLILTKLGFDDFVIRFNHRAILTGLLETAGVPHGKHDLALVALDKIDKIGRTGVEKEFDERQIGGASSKKLLSFYEYFIRDAGRQNFDQQERVGLSNLGKKVSEEESIIDAIVTLVSRSNAGEVLSETERTQAYNLLERQKNANIELFEAILESVPSDAKSQWQVEFERATSSFIGTKDVDLNFFWNQSLLLRTLGFAEANATAVFGCVRMMKLLELSKSPHARFDPSLARGLSYYTGTIMEINVPDLAGSLGGGGRYDGLIGMFGKEQIPACGFSLGLERILVVMDERNMFPAEVAATSADVMVTLLSEETAAESLKLANELRTQGLRVLVYPEPDKLGKQIKYADQINVPYVCVLGESEIAENNVTLKNMKTGEQETAFRIDIGEMIKR